MLKKVMQVSSVSYQLLTPALF